MEGRPLIIFSVMVIAAIVFFIIAGILFYQKQLSKKNAETLFNASGRNTKSRVLHSIYVFFNSFALTGNFIKRIRKRYEILEPGDIRKTEEDTIKTVLLVWGLSLSAFIIGAFIEFSITMIAVCGILAYAITTSILFSSIHKKEIELAKQLDQFIDATEHEYYATNMIETTLENLCSDAPEPIRSHMQKILEILDSGEDQDVTAYIDTTPNKFLQLYLSACMLVNNYDDKNVHGVSLFVTNLNHIKTEIGIWLRSQKLIEHKFKFHNVMILAPLCFIRVIDHSLVTAYDGLTAAYYKGAYGIIVSSFLCFAGFMIFNYSNRLKNMDYHDDNEHLFLQYLSNIPFVKRTLDAYEDRNYGKCMKMNRVLHQLGANMNIRFLQIQRFLWMVGTFIVSVIICGTIITSSRGIVLTTTSNLESALMYLVPDEQTRTTYVSYSIDLSEQLKDFDIEQDTVKNKVISDNITEDEAIQTLISDSVYDKVSKYQNTYFQWWYLLICAMIGIFGYQLPYILVMSRKDILVIAQENEVVQFQSIISMLMHIDQITVEDVLEWLDRFSILFKSSLDICIADMAAGEDDALDKLKENEPYLPFQRIVDNFADADKVGIENAFIEIDGDRESTQKKREQDSNMYIAEKANVSLILAFVSLLLLLLLYFSGPVLLSSMQSMNAIKTTIS